MLYSCTEFEKTQKIKFVKKLKKKLIADHFPSRAQKSHKSRVSICPDLSDLS